MYTCLDAALEGAVTAEYRESRGKPLMIRLEAFNVTEAELRHFFGRFTSEVPKLPDYAKALREQQFFPIVSFELNVEALKTPVVPDLWPEIRARDRTDASWNLARSLPIAA